MGTGSIPPPNPLAYEGQVVVPYILRTNPAEPETTFNKFPVPTLWINPSTERAWLLVSLTLGVATWIELASGGTGPLLEFAGGAGTTGFPVNPSGTGVVTLTSTGGTIAITGSTNAINFDLTGGGVGIDSITTNVGGPVVGNPSTGNILANASASTYTDGATANTLKIETRATNNAVVIGQGSSTPISSVGPGTNGQTLIGNTGAAPTFSAIGTLSGLTNHGVILGQGNSAFVATAVGATHSVFVGSTGANPSFSTTSTSYFTGVSFDSGTSTLNAYKDLENFTPTISGSAGGPDITYTAQSGTWSRIGSIVVAQLSVSWSATTYTGDVIVGGFPYNFGGGQARAPTCSVRVSTMTWPVGATYFIGQGLDATKTLKIEGFGDGLGAQNLQMQAAGDISLSIVYQTSDSV